MPSSRRRTSSRATRTTTSSTTSSATATPSTPRSAYKDRIASRYLDMLQQQMTWYMLLRADFTDIEASRASAIRARRRQLVLERGQLGQLHRRGRRRLRSARRRSSRSRRRARSPSRRERDQRLSGRLLEEDERRPLIAAASARRASRSSASPTASYIDTTWDFTGCGYYWADECQTRIGYFVDKTVALDVLTQSQAYFTGRDTSTDVRKYAIGYILPFKTQIEEKIGASVRRRLHSRSRRRCHDTATTSREPRGLVADPAEPGGARRRPTSSIRRAASPCSSTPASTALSAFPTTFDHSFIDTTKIFVVGNGEATVPDSRLRSARPTGARAQPGAAGRATAATRSGSSATDTATGKSYAAHVDRRRSPGRLGHARRYRNDTGVRMLETA